MTQASTVDPLSTGNSPTARRPSRSGRIADRALKAGATAWLTVAVLGQLMLAVYVVGFYGRAALHGQFQSWNQVMPHGYAPGQNLLNGVLASHLLFAVLIIGGGALQLVPQVRRRWPGFHRWSGRFYIVSAAVMSLGGLAMVLLRKTAGDLPQHLAVSLNALLVLAFAGIAWRHARAGRFAVHRRWALRLFLVVSGVWFFRIGLMLSIVLNRGPFGFDPETFTGPFLSVLGFAQYAVPLAVLELYFRAQDRGGPGAQLAMAAGLAFLTLATMAGIAAATTLMWLPRL